MASDLTSCAWRWIRTNQLFEQNWTQSNSLNSSNWALDEFFFSSPKILSLEKSSEISILATIARWSSRWQRWASRVIAFSEITNSDSRLKYPSLLFWIVRFAHLCHWKVRAIGIWNPRLAALFSLDNDGVPNHSWSEVSFWLHLSRCVLWWWASNWIILLWFERNMLIFLCRKASKWWFAVVVVRVKWENMFWNVSVLHNWWRIFVQLIEKRSLRLPLFSLFDDDENEIVLDRMISPCSLSSNVSLTKRLIEVGQCSSSDVHRFSNRSEWIDGLDQWSIGETLPSLSPSLQFDQDLRLYFPAEKSKEVSSKVSSKWNSLPSNESLPLRLQVLLDKAKDLSSARDQPLEDTFLPFDSFNSSSFEQSEEKRPKKKEKKHSVRCPRHPLRSIGTDCSSSSTSGKECLTHRHEEENLDKILKEHLTSLFTRGSISQRTSIQIPLINIKHDNHFTRSIPSLDSTIILQRYEKLQQLLIQPMKTIQRRQEQAEEETRTTFALTITPLGLTDNQPSKKNPLFDRLNQQTGLTSLLFSPLLF